MEGKGPTSSFLSRNGGADRAYPRQAIEKNVVIPVLYIEKKNTQSQVSCCIKALISQYSMY